MDSNTRELLKCEQDPKVMVKLEPGNSYDATVNDNCVKTECQSVSFKDGIIKQECESSVCMRKQVPKFLPTTNILASVNHTFKEESPLTASEHSQENTGNFIVTSNCINDSLPFDTPTQNEVTKVLYDYGSDGSDFDVEPLSSMKVELEELETDYQPCEKSTKEANLNHQTNSKILLAESENNIPQTEPTNPKNSEVTSSKKLGKGLVLLSQSKEIINNVANFMKKEAEEGITIPLKNHRKRILAATGVSMGTSQKISKEAMIIEWRGTSFKTPKKRRKIKKRKLDLVTAGQIYVIRQIIYDFYLLEKKLPTLTGIRQKIKDRGFLSEDLSISSLRRLFRSIGFRWHKAESNRRVLCESFDIRAKRIKFLKQIMQYRNEGRNIIYTGETYIDSSLVQDKRPKKPIYKGQRLIIVHAGGEKGFVKDALLILKSGTKTDEGHDDLNNKNFMNWVEKQLLPNLPEKSVIVLDNAAYHNVPVRNNITAASKKTDMINWLVEKCLPADPWLTKSELYEIVLENKHRFPTQYELDELLERHGHSVLRLPPHHPELNPIEEVWTQVKNWVASQNVTFKISDTEILSRQKFEKVTEQEWFNICQNVRQYEEELVKKEHLLDDALEEFVFRVNTGSSEEDAEETSDGDSVSEDEL